MPEAVRVAAACLGVIGLLLAFYALCVLVVRGKAGYKETRTLVEGFDRYRQETKFQHVMSQISTILFLVLLLAAGWAMIGIRVAEK